MAEPADNPSRRLIARLLQLRNALDAGADPLWVDYGVMVAVRRWLDASLPGLGLPSLNLVGALGDTLDGARPAYLNRTRGHRPKLESRLNLKAAVAFAMESLVTARPTVFRPRMAAILVARKLNAAGLRAPGGRNRVEDRLFTSATVTDWHQQVVYQATRAAPERAMFDLLMEGPRWRLPDLEAVELRRHRALCEAWLDRFIKGISHGYFKR